MIYLDYNATAPLRPEVKAAMVDAMDAPSNPSSVHLAGRKARKLVEEARAEILRSVNGEALVFCGSGTEANNLALAQGGGGVSEFQSFVSEIEHDSVFKYPKVKTFKVRPDGIVDLEDLKQKLRDSETPKLVSLMLANNETGIIQPVKEAAKIVHENGALFHTDAVQAFGKIPLDFKDLDCDLMTISSHKIGGPVGAAVLLHKPGLNLTPINYGGGQEKNKRPGTENVPAIIGFGKIASIVSRETFSGFRVQDLGFSDDMVIIGKDVERLPNTACIIMPGVESTTQLIHFDMAKICVSSGSACSSGKVELSRVLKAMGVKDAKSALRVSTGWATKNEDFEAFIKAWIELFNRTRKKAV